jgi:chorismate mutase
MTRGIRGAVCAKSNTKEAIFSATTQLLRDIIKQNELATEDIVSIFITATSDLNADFPAYAVRENGLRLVPVLCAVELSVPNAMTSVIRMMVHVNTDKTQGEIKHVYLGATAKLRPDLSGTEQEN